MDAVKGCVCAVVRWVDNVGDKCKQVTIVGCIQKMKYSEHSEVNV